MSQKNVTFYTKPGCSLCEKAMLAVNSVLKDIPFQLEVLDITGEPGLLREYELNIPVICINGIEVFRYHVNEAEFRSLLADNGE